MAATAQELLAQMKEFDAKQLAWYKHEVEWYTGEKEYVTKQIAEARKDDKQLVEHIYSKGPLTAMDYRLFGNNFQSTETKKLIAQRRHIRRQIKKYEAKVVYYTKKVEEDK